MSFNQIKPLSSKNLLDLCMHYLKFWTPLFSCCPNLKRWSSKFETRINVSIIANLWCIFSSLVYLELENMWSKFKKFYPNLKRMWPNMKSMCPEFNLFHKIRLSVVQKAYKWLQKRRRYCSLERGVYILKEGVQNLKKGVQNLKKGFQNLKKGVQN